MSVYAAHFPDSRFLLFCGAFYYPKGGWKDFIGSFPGTKEAKDYAFANADNKENDMPWEWYQVYDSWMQEMEKEGRIPGK